MNTHVSARQLSSAEEQRFHGLLRSVALLVVSSDQAHSELLCNELQEKCALLVLATTVREAEALRVRYCFDVVVLDVNLPGISGVEWVGQWRHRGIDTPVIFTAEQADSNTIISALRRGARDFIIKPLAIEQLMLSLKSTLMDRSVLCRNALLHKHVQQNRTINALLGDSAPMVMLREQCSKIGPHDKCVLIQGESGVGKQRLAEQLHQQSRCAGPMLSLNCANLSPEQLACGFFGNNIPAHNAAAVTLREDQVSQGWLVRADRGTLVLSNISYLPDALQRCLLEFLEHADERLSGITHHTLPDVRIVISSKESLVAARDRGELRADLLHRINAVRIRIPALRERAGDLQSLVHQCMDELFDRNPIRVPVPLFYSDWEKLQAHHWPGNLRELCSVVERIVQNSGLHEDWLIGNCIEPGGSEKGYPLNWRIEQVERAHIEAVLESLGNNKTAAARQLGVSRKTLERKQALWKVGSGED